MKKRMSSMLALLAAGAVTVLVVAGLSQAASPPVNQQPPTISGTPQVGQALTASPGKWSGANPITYSYDWRRCDNTGGSCSSISGANDKSYTLKPVDSGNTLRVHVVGKNSDGQTGATSVPTAVVTGAPPTSSGGCPTSGSGTLDISQISPPARLLVDQQQSDPSVITRSVTSITLRFHVTACNGRPIQSALVYATAVPFQQFTVPPEVSTGSDGWASLTLPRSTSFPVSSKQQLLAVFVRARKTGESALGGVSTSRLVSFPVSR